MSFISYAQNYEDVMLRRALKDVDNGFYIDVGANDPVTDSVTKAFYDAGWRGINIEPVSEWFKKLQEDRPEDINLQLAVGACKGKVDFYEVIGTGLSTMDESIAKRHAKEHGFEIDCYKVPVARLSTICEQYPHENIHFLKIDVEGAEYSALKGLNLKKIRPWIIVVESTLPNQTIEAHQEWEHCLTEHGYHHVYFDGLNRYYVADEHNELDSTFTSPPNYFDSFKRASEDWLEHHAQRLEKGWGECKTKYNQIEETLEQAESNLQETKQQHQQLEKQVQSLQVEAVQYDEKLREKETKQQELLLSMVEKETRLQEAATTLIDNKQETDKLLVSLADGKTQQQALEATLQETKQQHQQLEKQVQSLEESINQLNSERASAKHQIDELHHSNHHWWSMTDQQNKELEETRAKIDKLNHSSHHWWLEAELLNKELQSVYDSKSWRITQPLRKLSQLFKWLLSLPIRLIFWTVYVPKRTARWLLVKAMAFALKHSCLRVRAVGWLHKYPRLNARLHQLAQAHSLIAVQTSPSKLAQPVQGPPENKVAMSDTDISDLTPNARRIYGELKIAMTRCQKGTD